VSDMNAPAWVSSSHRPMGFPEFVIVIASIMALNPLAMDMMLPAMPNIGTAFHITAANRPQMVLSIFLLGFGVGQFVMGPLSDRFGRRPILLGGMAVYCVASLLAIAAPSFETLLLARALQGVGTSATRVIHAAHAPMKLVYTCLAYQSRDLALAGLLFSQRVVA
jgi:DHA1 family bicyclomycin/chloramphenicol resistance-like MFS transporter